MTEEIGIGIPEYSVETKDHFVQIAESQPVDGGQLPFGQRWREFDYVIHGFATIFTVHIVGRRHLFQYTQWQSTKDHIT